MAVGNAHTSWLTLTSRFGKTESLLIVMSMFTHEYVKTSLAGDYDAKGLKQGIGCQYLLWCADGYYAVG